MSVGGGGGGRISDNNTVTSSTSSAFIISMITAARWSASLCIVLVHRLTVFFFFLTTVPRLLPCSRHPLQPPWFGMLPAAGIPSAAIQDPLPVWLSAAAAHHVSHTPTPEAGRRKSQRRLQLHFEPICITAHTLPALPLVATRSCNLHSHTEQCAEALHQTRVNPSIYKL